MYEEDTGSYVMEKGDHTTGKIPVFLRKSTLRRICMMIMLLLAIFPVSAKAEEKKVVRIGYFIDNTGFQDGAADDERKSGYAYEYYQELAKYTGWEYEYVYGPWGEIYNKLLNGEVDIMGDITKTESRAGKILYPDSIMGEESYYIFVPSNNFAIKDISSLNNTKIGVNDKSYMQELFQSFVQENELDCEIISYQDSEDRINALRAGEIDGMVSVDNYQIEGVKPVLYVGESEFYIGVSKDRPDILEELNDAQEHITDSDPYYIERLQEKYFNRSFARMILLDEEKEWLKEHPTLKVGYLTDYLPFCGTDPDTGKMTGMLNVILEQLTRFMGTEFVTLGYDEYDDIIKALNQGEIDMVFPVYGDLWFSEQQKITQTVSVVTARCSVVYAGNYRKDIYDRIAVSRSSPVQDYFVRTNYPKAERISLKNMEECLEAVNSGEVGCVLVSSDVMFRIVNKNIQFTKLQTAEIEDSVDYCFAVRHNDTTLYSILNMGLRSIDESVITEALIRNSYVYVDYTIKDFVTEHIVGVAAAVIGVILFIIAFFTYHGYRMRKNQLVLQKAYDKEKAFAVAQKEAKIALQDAYDSAKRANMAKSDFLSRMSHDIRTPMNAIIGMTAIAATHLDNPQRVADCLEKVTASSRHLLTLINEVLDMSKIESGKMELAEENFSIAELLDNVLTMVGPQAKAKEHSIKVSMHDVAHENVAGDYGHLQQAFVNIMGNAVKYTPQGGKIHLTLTEKATNKSRVGCFEFVFEDNGIGMSQEFVQHVFEPFARENDTDTAQIQGTGLGLAITQNIIRMMGGDINLESEKGKGTRFTVTVYLKLLETETESEESLTDLPVLVVDDEQDACESTCQILNEMGMKSEWVLTGREAVEKVVLSHEKENDYFVVLLDWKMPEMDGVQTAREIRRAVGDEVPIIVLSAYDWSDIEAEARAAGVNAFISKPLFKSRLISLFEELIRGGEKKKEYPLEKFSEVSFKGKRVLLAEDNELNAEIATEILETTGLTVEVAKNGREAVDMLLEKAPGYYDMVLMDIQMPLMNGYEATRTIRSSEREDLKTIPIIAMTANAYAGDVQEAMRAGMNQHVSKPLDFAYLMKTLKKWLN